MTSSEYYWMPTLKLGLQRSKKFEPHFDPLTEDDIENIKKLSNKKIAVKMLYYCKTSKEKIKEILGVDSDFIEEALKYN